MYARHFNSINSQPKGLSCLFSNKRNQLVITVAVSTACEKHMGNVVTTDLRTTYFYLVFSLQQNAHPIKEHLTMFRRAGIIHRTTNKSNLISRPAPEQYMCPTWKKRHEVLKALINEVTFVRDMQHAKTQSHQSVRRDSGNA